MESHTKRISQSNICYSYFSFKRKVTKETCPCEAESNGPFHLQRKGEANCSPCQLGICNDWQECLLRKVASCNFLDHAATLGTTGHTHFNPTRVASGKSGN
ncbi:MAG: hypothetical protein C4518_18330 [Desulfobacteraceae bacterium]|nr:MAG: hypothetical protein C4518_18330 [Desulfobacteraceae bacterium]